MSEEAGEFQSLNIFALLFWLDYNYLSVIISKTKPHQFLVHKENTGLNLVPRQVATGKEYFIHPGGKIEAGETAKQAVIRELKEEFQIDVSEDDLRLFDKNSAPAANSPEVNVHMEVFMVEEWRGEIIPDNEVEEVRWLTSQVPTDIRIGSIMEHETIPKLKAEGLID